LKIALMSRMWLMMTPSSARRWLLLADFCAIIAAVVGTEAGSPKLRMDRATLLTGAGAYLLLTGAVLFVLSRRAQPPVETARGTSMLGRRGPAFLGYLPRLILGAALLAYAFRP
jgi:hypothetical protein